MPRSKYIRSAGKTPTQHFMMFVSVQPNGCWLWTGKLFSKGYGMFRRTENRVRKTYYAHKFSYELFVGPVPEGLELDHTCHNSDCTLANQCPHRRCVNPEHVEPVTHAENVRRSWHGNSANKKKTHCKYGHPFEGDNLAILLRATGKNSRRCNMCHREALERYENNKKERIANEAQQASIDA